MVPHDSTACDAVPGALSRERVSELGRLLRQALFQLNTRRFGTVAELFIQRLKALDRAQSPFHDFYDSVASQRVEVKFSTVLTQWKTPLRQDTLEAVLKEALSERRTVQYENWKTQSFDCNIQQVKPAEFDVLYYGLFFDDAVVVFRCAATDVPQTPGWSSKQHKGNQGEGQFHVTSRNLSTHLEHRLMLRLTYDGLAELLFAA